MNKSYCLFILILLFLSCTTSKESYTLDTLSSCCNDSSFFSESFRSGHHVIKYILPSKYKRYENLNANPETFWKIYGKVYGDLDLRSTTVAYIADSVKLNTFSINAYDSGTPSCLDDYFERNFKEQYPCYEYYYDIKKERLSNGNEKKVFVCIFPRRLWRRDKELCLETLIRCSIATPDSFQYVFMINAQEFPEQFDFNEKMKILNSIVVE
ncbi:MAG: hypothetical protein UE068_10170 [Paludibacteraceae bacterium]|nr:hypothetical protein [Paludibacteraceae bacterium]